MKYKRSANQQQAHIQRHKTVQKQLNKYIKRVNDKSYVQYVMIRITGLLL